MARRDLVETPYGRCVIVEVDESQPLIGAEQTHAATLGPTRRREFIAGRAALRAALAEHSVDAAVAILPDDRGAPMLPRGWIGSISHKGDRAAAIVARAGETFVGVDLELAAPPRQPIERRILTPNERASGAEITRVFAIKEAIYKAIDPIVRRYVGFTEVELAVARDGSVAVRVLDVTRLPVEIEAWWAERDGHWLATARARRR